MQKRLFSFLTLIFFSFLISASPSSKSSGFKQSAPLLLARNGYNSPANPLSEKKYRADEAPHPLQGIKVKEYIGEKIDLDLRFVDETAQVQSLGNYFKDQPVLLTIIYYNCPSLCNFHLNGLFEGLNNLKWNNYQMIAVSMDHTEKPPLAKEKKQNYLKEFSNMSSDRVHFLTGSKESINILAKSLGFAFHWDEETEQFAHSPVAYTISPKAMISRYLYGVEFLPQTLKLALLEAGREKIGNMIDRVLLFCYRFNPETNQYSLYALNIMKAGGLLIVLVLIMPLAPIWLKERKYAF